MKIKNCKIAVIGLGVSGISSLKLLKFLGNYVIAVNSGAKNSWSNLETITCFSDEQVPQAEFTHDQFDYSLIDYAIISPGISLNQSFVNRLKKNQVIIFGEIELAYQVIKNDKSKIISVTGTNGKTSTVTMVNELLRSSGYDTFIGGNIGVPLADYALERLKTSHIVDFIVLELSSFQLETILDFKSDTACILNLSAHHGERYKHFSDYINAKNQIFNHIFETKNKIIRTNDYNLIKNSTNLPCDQIDEKKLSNLDTVNLNDFSLVGYHNRINLSFALSLINSLNIKLPNIQKSICSMKGVAHRLEHVELKNSSLKAFNDAKSTNWDATLTAISSINSDFPGQTKKLILGGKLRGENDSITAHFKLIKESIDYIFLYGESADLIGTELLKLGFDNFYKANKLEDIFEESSVYDFNGVLIFSPAFPSFDQFNNYAQRGELFRKLIKEVN